VWAKHFQVNGSFFNEDGKPYLKEVQVTKLPKQWAMILHVASLTELKTSAHVSMNVMPAALLLHVKSHVGVFRHNGWDVLVVKDRLDFLCL
jgi:hypothetical protein